MISVCLAFVKVSHLCLPQLSNLFIQRSFLPLKIQKRTITRFLGVQHLPQRINVLLKSRTTWSTGPSWKNTRLDSHQDFIHFQPPIMKCKRENMPFLHRCKPLFHDHLSCQNETWGIILNPFKTHNRLTGLTTKTSVTDNNFLVLHQYFQFHYMMPMFYTKAKYN